MLALSPATVSSRVRLTEIPVLTVGLPVILTANALLLRRRVELVLDATADAVRLSISDDGRGGVVDEGPGIRGMRERALLVGADLAISSVPGSGTRVAPTVPLPVRAGARHARPARPHPVRHPCGARGAVTSGPGAGRSGTVDRWVGGGSYDDVRSRRERDA